MVKKSTAAEQKLLAAKLAAESTLVATETAAAMKLAADAELEIDDSFPVVAGVDPTLQFNPLHSGEQSNESKLRDVVDSLMSTEGMEVRSVLETKHEIALIRIAMFAEKYKSPLARYLYDMLLQIRVSHGGRGRKDMVAAMKAALRGDDHEDSDEMNKERKRSRLFR